MILPTLLLCAPAKTAPDYVEAAFLAMGGRGRLAEIGRVDATIVGHSLLVEQSERPEGPYVVSYFDREETLDFDKKEWRGKQTFKGLIYGGTMAGNFAIAQGKPAAVEGRNLTMPGMADDAQLRFQLGPERLLFTASQAKDLRLGRALSYQGVPHREVQFSWGPVPVTILFNEATNMPTAVETVRTEPGFWSIWGDVRRRTIWGTWDLRSNGAWFPLEWTQTMNGQTVSEWTVLDAKFTVGGGAESVKIDPPAIVKPRTFEAKQYKQTVVTPGITAWQGPFNTGVIEQSDGLVVLECVNDSSFASSLIDDLKARFPNKKVKGVITTTDAWPHFGGLRTFVARGIPVYCSKRNVPILERYLAAPHKISPDELQTRPAKAKFIAIDRPVSIGTGTEKLTIYPVAGEGSERMLMAYWPAKGVLYSTDLIQPQGKSFFTPGYVKEVANAVRREGLHPETVFGMHLAPMAWSAVEEFLKTLGG